MSGHNAPTLDEVRTWPATVSVATACQALGISHGHGYQLIKKNEFPCRVLVLGTRTQVVTAALIRLLDGQSEDAGQPVASAS